MNSKFLQRWNLLHWSETSVCHDHDKLCHDHGRQILQSIASAYRERFEKSSNACFLGLFIVAGQVYQLLQISFGRRLKTLKSSSTAVS